MVRVNLSDTKKKAFELRSKGQPRAAVPREYF